MIRARLLKANLGWGFRGEETRFQPPAAGENHLWLVDPNDGTESMQAGFSVGMLSLSLCCGPASRCWASSTQWMRPMTTVIYLPGQRAVGRYSETVARCLNEHGRVQSNRTAWCLSHRAQIATHVATCNACSRPASEMFRALHIGWPWLLLKA